MHIFITQQKIKSIKWPWNIELTLHVGYVNIAINCIDQNRTICIINIKSASYYVQFNV